MADLSMLDYSRKVAIRIVNGLETKWPHMHCDGGFDTEEATDLIENLLPMTVAQAEAEAETWDDTEPPPPQGPSLIQQLREALGVSHEKGLSLRGTLELAISTLNTRNDDGDT